MKASLSPSALRLVSGLLVLLPAAMVGAADAPAGGKPGKVVGYDDTPLQPNGKWRVHDGTRPAPKVIAPGRNPGQAPADAIVLLGGPKDAAKWQHGDGAPITWKWRAGALESGKGSIETKDKWKDFQLHIEWASPKPAKDEGQGRGNSGVFLLGNFEIQVLDSFENQTYPDGQASAMYGQYPPLVNVSRKPGQWQTYDIVFTAPRFKNGKVDKPAVVTVLHNGVVTHNATPFFGPTSHKQNPPYEEAKHAEGPIRLQDHGNPVRFRNIWIRPLAGYDQP